MTFSAYISVVSNTGQPVPGATVTLRSIRAVTDATGAATLAFDPSGLGVSSSLTLTASAPGYSDASQTVNFPAFVTIVTVVVVLSPDVASSLVTVLVRDQGTQQPLAGARVFANGQPPLVTSSSGQVQLVVSSGSTQVTVTASSYQDASQNALGSGALVFDLLPDVSGPRSVQIVVEPRQSTLGGNVQLTDGSLPVVFLPENYQIGQDGSFATTPSHSTGSLLSLTITHPSFQTLTTVVLLDSRTSYVVGPLTALSGNADAGQAGGAPPGAGSDQVSPAVADSVDNVVPLSLVQPPDSYEYVYPSGDYGKYFTTTQARMYVGNLFVDELHTVQFALQANRVPIYGYASRDFDAVALGRSLVQGQIFINFISEGYLYTIVKEHAKLAKSQRDAENPDEQNQQQFNNLRLQHVALTSGRLTAPGNIPGLGSNPDGSPQLPQADVRVQLIEQKMGQLAALGPAVIDNGRFFQPGPGGPAAYNNAAYLPFGFDIEVELVGAGRVVKRRLEKCYLGANEQILDQSGEVLGESYSFIARRLR